MGNTTSTNNTLNVLTGQNITVLPKKKINNNILISIDGNIGSGKSTLVKNLIEHYKNNKQIIFLKEPVDEWEQIKDKEGTTILKKFYNDQKKYAFSFQMMAYISRYKILKKVIDNNKDCILITERSIFTDKHVFAKMLSESEDIEDVNYQIYTTWFDTLSDECKIDKLIYIDSNPELCKQRIIKRAREGEEGIPIEYLNNCDKYHKNMTDKDSKDCVCNDQLVLDGSVDIYENEEHKLNMIKQVDNFIYDIVKHIEFKNDTSNFYSYFLKFL